MITSVSNENDFKDPIYIYIRIFGPDPADFDLVSADMMEVDAKWLSFISGDGRDIMFDGAWLTMERPSAFLFAIKYTPYIISTFSGAEMDLLVPRIRQETEMILLTLGKIAIAKDLGHITDLEEFLYITETMNLVRIVTDYVSTAYFM